MSEYRIARVNIEAIDDGMLVEPIYYKVFLVTENGDWWFEAEFDSIEECEDYIELSKKYPDKGSLEKALMVGEKRRRINGERPMGRLACEQDIRPDFREPREEM